MTPALLVHELDKGPSHMLTSSLGERRGVSLRTFGPKGEHKVWSPRLKTFENKRSMSVILSQDQGEATKVLDGAGQDRCWPKKPKAGSPS